MSLWIGSFSKNKQDAWQQVVWARCYDTELWTDLVKCEHDSDAQKKAENKPESVCPILLPLFHIQILNAVIPKDGIHNNDNNNDDNNDNNDDDDD